MLDASLLKVPRFTSRETAEASFDIGNDDFS
jgi:hypothetical protein